MRFLSVVAVFLFSFSFATVGFAEENGTNVSDVKLTQEELDYLVNEVGNTKEESEELPVEVSRQLIEEEAEVIDSGTEIMEIYIPEFNQSGQMQISNFASIAATTLKLGGTVYKVKSDRSKEDKFYIYGNFQWLKTPSYNLVDKMTIGFPSSSGLYLPTSGGKVKQHQHRYSQDQQGNGRWIDYAIKYSPSNWEPSAGVAGSYDLKASTSKTKHKGYIGQYVYVPTSKNGKINIKLAYGHRRVAGTPSVSVYPAGLSITPTTATDTRSYALTLSY
ncbi:hypothetical protein SRABI96_03539 [Peribacillus sp. Bi96]|uniref:hypothetical protein n=1 Tax=unclassified Peribacillus TaxID=2675266 RepID=UPI001D5BDD97|nr:hypothetical protein [Peribacillus sp. Bi96]CAH0265318.1 hypothetical protein SRABI96_03539 [Peribacillus sp. Bi96]